MKNTNYNRIYIDRESIDHDYFEGQSGEVYTLHDGDGAGGKYGKYLSLKACIRKIRNQKLPKQTRFVLYNTMKGTCKYVKNNGK